jgi:hypothetical protein
MSGYIEDPALREVVVYEWVVDWRQWMVGVNWYPSMGNLFIGPLRFGWYTAIE